jgi:hypothetical protein
MSTKMRKSCSLKTRLDVIQEAENGTNYDTITAKYGFSFT